MPYHNTTKETVEVGGMSARDELIEAIRLGYLTGVNDTEEGAEQWCSQGSRERAEDLLDDLISDGLFKVLPIGGDDGQ